MAGEHPQGPQPPTRPREQSGQWRGALVTLAVLGLGIGIFAVLPSRPAASPAKKVPPSSHHRKTPTSSTTSTTVPATTSSTPATRVAVLSPAGAPDEPAIVEKLSDAHYTLVHEAAIPSSWVSTLASPLVRYPSGYESEADTVATTLGVSRGVVESEPAGTSDGADVVEVWVPSSAT